MKLELWAATLLGALAFATGMELRLRGAVSPAPAPAPAPVTRALPSVVVTVGGTVDVCPVGKLVPLETKRKSVTVEKCSQLVQAAKAAKTCGNVFVVKRWKLGDSKKEEATPVGYAACACCPPQPKKDCVNCLAGQGTVGWQTRPTTVASAGWEVRRLAVDAPAQASCSSRAFASWAAMGAYINGLQDLGGPRLRDMNFAYMMQTAFWKNVAAWSPVNFTETDHASLWSKKGDCILAFRGSDSFADFKNNMDQSPTNYLGLTGVFVGVAKEFQAVFKAMQAGLAFALIRKTCSKEIIVSGHSLGGATSQLFSVLANKIGDPLRAGITVDRYYGFGGMPVGLSEFSDDKHPYGCFPGGLYFNMHKDSAGRSFIDLLSHQGVQSGYKWVKAAKVLTWNYKEFKVLPCGAPLKRATPKEPFNVLGFAGLPPGIPALSPGQLQLHDATQYVDNVGCRDNSGLEPKKWPEFKAPTAGLVVGENKTIAQCPIGASIPVFKNRGGNPQMTPDACAQHVRQKKVEGICGNLYSVKVVANSPMAGMPSGSSTVCSCCQPRPPQASCVSCSAGSGNAGWETGPNLAADSSWRTMILADDPTKASTCGSAALGSWAAMAAYRDSPMMAVSNAYMSNYKFMMNSAFWSLKASWGAANASDSDYSELWVKGSDCILSFRGTDSGADRGNMNLLSPGLYHGLMLAKGITVEWGSMLTRFRQAKAFATILKSCPKPVAVTGHGMGGALAQVFAVMANKIGDPLRMGLTVGSVYGFGASPIGSIGVGEPFNEKSFDGCFSGGMYANIKRIGAKDVIDPVFTKGMKTGLRHVKTAKYLMTDANKKVIFKCGDPVMYQNMYSPDSRPMPLHDYSAYTGNVGC